MMEQTKRVLVLTVGLEKDFAKNKAMESISVHNARLRVVQREAQTLQSEDDLASAAVWLHNLPRLEKEGRFEEIVLVTKKGREPEQEKADFCDRFAKQIGHAHVTIIEC
jgi:hypothetical protein